MNQANAHILSIAEKMAKTMAMLDDNAEESDYYFVLAYNFVLCKFALKIQQADLATELANKEIPTKEPTSC